MSETVLESLAPENATHKVILNRLKSRLYYDKHREEILIKRRVENQKKREANGTLGRRPGRPRLARPALEDVLAELNKSAGAPEN